MSGRSIGQGGGSPLMLVLFYYASKDIMGSIKHPETSYENGFALYGLACHKSTEDG